MKKQNLGQFNTKNKVWLRPHIRDFIANSGCKYVMDPYAGAGDLLCAVNSMGWSDTYGYDIDPDLGWPVNDGLKDVPEHENTIVVTNPPYLAKNSAARNDLESYQYFKNNDYEDLYQLAIHRVLARYSKAVFIIPETFYQNQLFTSYLHSYTIIEENPFEDTDCPVCVAAFHATNDFRAIAGNNYKIYKNDSYLFNRFELEDTLFKFNSGRHADITFNDPGGMLGLRAVDGVHINDRIRFAKPKALRYDLRKVSETSRSVTLIDVPGYKIDKRFIKIANLWVENLREDTKDVVLSPFKNNNKLGKRRRRLDYKWARKIIEKTMETLDK